MDFLPKFFDVLNLGDTLDRLGVVAVNPKDYLESLLPYLDRKSFEPNRNPTSLRVGFVGWVEFNRGSAALYLRRGVARGSVWIGRGSELEGLE